MESIERKALFLLVALAIFLAFDRPDAFTTTYGRGWQVVVYIVGLLAAAGAAVALAARSRASDSASAPARAAEPAGLLLTGAARCRELSNVLLRAYATYYLHRHGSSIWPRTDRRPLTYERLTGPELA